MTELLVADIGGTHARFAIATLGATGIALSAPVTLATDDFADLDKAWEECARQLGAPLPPDAAIAAAGPVRGEAIVLTNNRWTIKAADLRARQGFERVTLINDFGAVAHAAASAAEEQLAHIAGPDRPLPALGTVSVIGPGTGLGVAQFHRGPHGTVVQASEGGHIGFAPQDALDDRVLAGLRSRYTRVVAEHVVAGPGIAAIYAALGGTALSGDRAIWAAGLDRSDGLASAAVDRFCGSLGAAAGDYALAHGASGVVLAGGLGLKLRERLAASDFAARFAAKPRYEAMMADIPVKLITHPQPGLLGAAAAFLTEHGNPA